MVEENKHNPTITKVKLRNSKNHFLIKYKDEQERVAYSDLILRLAKNYELKDFHVEENLAFEESRVMYNYHCVLKEGDFSYKKLESAFLRFYED